MVSAMIYWEFRSYQISISFGFFGQFIVNVLITFNFNVFILVMKIGFYLSSLFKICEGNKWLSFMSFFFFELCCSYFNKAVASMIFWGVFDSHFVHNPLTCIWNIFRISFHSRIWKLRLFDWKASSCLCCDRHLKIFDLITMN